MDLETENRIAAILLKEAAESRLQAQKDGALAYLHQPTVRCRPNSRFLTATVRGVQQANRVVEVNEMWRLREKQLELENKHIVRNEGSGGRGCKDVSESRRSKSCGNNQVETSASASLSSRKRSASDLDPMEDEGLRDDEVDDFLHSRTKRGRGAVGSRMNDAGPYLPSSPDSRRNALESNDKELKKDRVVLGPKKPSFIMSSESSSDDESYRDKKKKATVGSSKRHSKKQKLKEKSKDKKKKKSREKKR